MSAIIAEPQVVVIKIVATINLMMYMQPLNSQDAEPVKKDNKCLLFRAKRNISLGCQKQNE